MKKVQKYEKKIRMMLENRLNKECNYGKVISDVKIWLCCEHDLGMIGDISLYVKLRKKIDAIADEIIKGLN